jgi:hypothetical protein
MTITASAATVAADLDYYVGGNDNHVLASQIVEVLGVHSSENDGFVKVVDLIWNGNRSAGYDAALFAAKEIFVNSGNASSIVEL